MDSHRRSCHKYLRIGMQLIASSHWPIATNAATSNNEVDGDEKKLKREASDLSSPNCSICWCEVKHKCFADPCLHEFCFDCLLRWSKIKADCPLCRRSFKSIIHNVKSMYNYEVYRMESLALSDNRIEEVSSLIRTRTHRFQSLPAVDTIQSAYISLNSRRLPGPRSNLPNVTDEIAYMSNESISSRSVIVYGENSRVSTTSVSATLVTQASDSGLHRGRLFQKSDDCGLACAKILFFSLMAVLVLIVLIMLEDRLISGLDTAGVPL